MSGKVSGTVKFWSIDFKGFFVGQFCPSVPPLSRFLSRRDSAVPFCPTASQVHEKKDKIAGQFWDSFGTHAYLSHSPGSLREPGRMGHRDKQRDEGESE
jgi:hypothetical protein